MKEAIFASDLSAKKVVDTSGSEIGVLDHLRIEATTGDLTNLLVRPVPNLKVGEFETSGSLIVLPFAAVKAVKDVVVVDSARFPRVRAAVAASAEAKSEPEEGSGGKAPSRREPRGGAPGEAGARRTVGRVKEQPAPAEVRRREVDEPRGHEPTGRVKAPSTLEQKRGAPGDERPRRTVSRVKEQPAPPEESSELEGPSEQGTSEAALRTQPANDRAQRRLLRGIGKQPPAFEHPAFRRPVPEKQQGGGEPQEPPKGEQQ